ncbi:FMN-dependent NADH-azoreductase [Chengkuizengella axinellae]|uniref:FMN dependent NADH:quinone oxidoreductase n=1 Tax=Chengkuizengella axinellae TaxID=3064388 RepID=A0ABT9J6G1_9BACL|nr:FMN-dependent NADH-azoreductase [Chengkuizengella sp. 2205SS18-9]MDP5276585.1 FMN-dependent NADH-azoreductase [Chengkuizengella sp. 2205SS18-9]
MATLLYVKGNPKQDKDSYSLRLGNAFIETYKAENLNDEVVELDLYKEEIPLIDGDILSAWGKFASNQELTQAEQEKVGKMNELTEQFLQADKVIFAAPMWNFGYPPMVKAYIDSIAIAGKTFKYTENGPVGLAGDKSVVLLEVRGGIYSEGPAKGAQHTESYLQTVMGFLGIQNFQAVVCEGVNMGGNPEDIYQAAENKAKDVAKSF